MRRRDGGQRGLLTAEIVAVGTELLQGDGVDTNSAWLSQRLVGLGIAVRRHTTVSDDAAELVAALVRATREHDVVLVGGGLGPTPDDITRFAVAKVAGVGLRRHDDLVDGVRARFAARGRDMPASNLVQADLPEGAAVIPPAGTAAGFTLDVDGALVVCLPGVPAELRAMADDHVVPLLRRTSGAHALLTRTVRTSGIAESAVADRCHALAERLAGDPDLDLAFLAGGGEVLVRVTAHGDDLDAAAVRAAPVLDELVDLLGPWVVGLDDERAEHVIARHLGARGWTLAVAESITGGGLGARLVTVPGASDWFAGGLITYATPVKSLLAGVPTVLLDRDGPVSEPVAVALASGARERLGTDVGLAVVGVAGPTTQGGREVGTVCVGVALPGGATHAHTAVLPVLDRADVQRRSATLALDVLRRRLVAPA